jgi:hypothetical protein
VFFFNYHAIEMNAEKKKRHRSKSSHEKQLGFFMILGLCLMVAVMVLLLWLMNGRSMR